MRLRYYFPQTLISTVAHSLVLVEKVTWLSLRTK
jgi:hypothetical protein